MRIIVISGTPGTGKTSISKAISNLINAKIISLNQLVINENLIMDYDKIRETSIIDKRRLIKQIKALIRKFKRENIDYLIFESHFSDIVPSKFIDLAIVLRCDPEELFTRLEDRGYKKEKIVENVQSEILGNCANYLLNKKMKKPILELNTSNNKIESIAETISDLITDKLNYSDYKLGKIDWIETLNLENKLGEFFS